MSERSLVRPALHSLQLTLARYPREFWILFGATLVNATGLALMTPFLTLYMRVRFNLPMTSVGTILAAMAVVGVASGLLIGALADRFGRKRLVVLGLGLAAFTALGLGLTDSPLVLVVLIVFYSFLYPTFGPNSPPLQAMVADLVEPEERAQAFSLIRMIGNLGMAIGPAIAGFLSRSSYFSLFLVNAVASLLVLALMFLFIRETKPRASEKDEHAGQYGYGVLMRDKAFLFLFALGVVVAAVYTQMNSTLPVFVKEQKGLGEEQYGLIMSLNAGLVVLFQVPLTRWTSRYAQTAMLALGTWLFAIGFGMTAFVDSFPLFVLSVTIWSVGEMVYVPVLQAHVANHAPIDMRARYLGVIGLTWTFGMGLGPLLAGIIMDYGNPEYIWYGCFVIGSLAALVFLWMGRLRGYRVDSQSVV